MAIAFDAATDGFFQGGTDLTFAHTCSGSDRILHVSVVTSTDVVSGCTYNGVAMTRVAGVADDVANAFIVLFELVAPATGSNNVVVTTSASATKTGHALSHTGASQTGQPDSSATGHTGNFITVLDITTTVVASGCWLVACFQASNGGIVAGTGSPTIRVDSSGFRVMADSNGTVGTGSQTIGITCGGSAINGVAVSIAPVAAAGGQPTMRRFGGVSHMGTGRLKGAGGGPWGRSRSGIVIPKWLSDQERQAA